MKIFLFNKKQFFFTMAVTALCVMIIACVFPLANTLAVNASARKLPIYNVETDEKKVAVTFDCAWGNSDSDELLTLLEENGAKATFFTTGDWCERYPDDVKRFAAAGHDIGNHSYAHPHVATMDVSKLREDTEKCSEKIKELIGTAPALYRAPYGEYSNPMMSTIEEMGYKVIQWDCDSVDWKGRGADEMAATILKKVGNGSILLFHNDTENTPQAVKQVITALKKQEYEFVLVKDLIYNEDYTIDNAGKQHRNSDL